MTEGARTLAAASLCVLSGISQPLIMNVCKSSGLADPKAELYMFFYYLGPSALVFGLIRECYRQTNRGASPSTTTTTRQLQLPSQRAVLEARGIASFDIIAQAMNYTGAGLAGSSIFSIIYSSVTVWTAIWSRLFLQRTLSWTQWLAVWIVFGGLVIAGTHSTELGSDVMTGTLLVVVGSAMHGAVYVMGEALMNHGDPSDRL